MIMSLDNFCTLMIFEDVSVAVGESVLSRYVATVSDIFVATIDGCGLTRRIWNRHMQNYHNQFNF